MLERINPAAESVEIAQPESVARSNAVSPGQTSKRPFERRPRPRASAPEAAAEGQLAEASVPEIAEADEEETLPPPTHRMDRLA
jgi:hypothetical protein